MAFHHQQSVEAFQAQVDACLAHDTSARLAQIAAPTLVLAGELDTILPPRLSRSVAAEIPNARRELCVAIGDDAIAVPTPSPSRSRSH